MLTTIVVFGLGTAFGVLCEKSLRRFFKNRIKPAIQKASDKL